jgi:hypothetical protein
LSISPDGSTVAVGHKYGVSIYSLLDGVRTKFLISQYPIYDLALAGNGYLYYSAGKLTSVNVSTGEEYQTELYYMETSLALHPDGTSLFLCNYNFLVRMDIKNGQPTVSRESAISSTRVWFNDFGNRFLTTNGQLYQVSDLEHDDLKYIGDIDQRIFSIQAAVVENKYAYLIPGTNQEFGESQILRYDLSLNELVNVMNLPVYANETDVYPYYGKFMFRNNTNDNNYIIVQAYDEHDQKIPENFALVVY